jgi:simple sugar transport system ATP-binding protein
LIASQPTRGIDIGAQALIWEKLRESRDKGLGVLLISADLEELIGLSDRIVVFYQGSVVTELTSEHVSPEDLGGYMTGLKK